MAVHQNPSAAEAYLANAMTLANARAAAAMQELRRVLGMK